MKYNISANAQVKVTPIKISEIKLNKTEINILLGSFEVLSVNILPENATSKALTWISEDPSIATVDEAGKVVGIAIGSTLVIVESDDKQVSASAKVNVLPVPIEALKFERQAVSLFVDEIEQLIVTMDPTNATPVDLLWSVSDIKVLTVDDKGNIMGIKPGTSQVTVSTPDGKLKETITVTVKEVPIEYISLNKSNLNLLPNDSRTLLASIYPKNAADQQILWYSGNPEIASVDQFGKITAHKTGSAIITAVTWRDDHTATCTVSVISPTEAIQVEVKPGSAVVNSFGATLPILVAVYNPSNTPVKVRTINILISGTLRVSFNITTIPFTNTYYYYELGPYFFPTPLRVPGFLDNWIVHTEYEMNGEIYHAANRVPQFLHQFSSFGWGDFDIDFYGVDNPRSNSIQFINLKSFQAVELKGKD